MSITTDITRITAAKADIAAAIESRGGAIGTAHVDGFADILDACPGVVYGLFTPEADTDTFSVGGLSFAPNTLYLICAELESTTIANSWVKMIQSPSYGGGLRVNWDENGISKFASVSVTSSAFTWTSNSVTFVTSASSSNRFRAGYTYRYIIAGGAQ